MKDGKKLVVDSNQTWVVTHIVVATAFAVAAFVLKNQEDLFLTGLFSVVAGINIVFSVLARRLKVTLDGDMLEVHYYLSRKSMSIKNLVSAGFLAGKGGGAIYMRNDQGQNLSIPFKFRKQDMVELVKRIQPNIMEDGVKRDTYVEKFMAKYIA